MRNTALQLREQVSLREELRAALSLLRLQDVRGFLFEPDARVDAAIVTSSRAHSQAFAMHLNANAEFVGPTDFDEHFSFNLAFNWLFLPAIEQTSYSLGVLLAKDDHRARGGLLNPGFDTTRFIRYMRDAGRGYVSVGFFEDGAELLYLPNCRQSLRSRYSKMFRFNTDSFKSVMASAIAADTDPDVDALLQCLNLVYAHQDYRHCPLCGVPPAISCDCVLPPTCPYGKAFKEIMYHTRGEYDGDCVVDLFAGGVSYRTMSSLQRTTFDMRDNGALASQLLSWAARDRLRVLSPSLPRLAMPAIGDTQPHLISVDPSVNIEDLSDFDLNIAANQAPLTVDVSGFEDSYAATSNILAGNARDNEGDLNPCPFPEVSMPIGTIDVVADMPGSEHPPGTYSIVVARQPHGSHVEALGHRSATASVTGVPPAVPAPSTTSAFGVPGISALPSSCSTAPGLLSLPVQAERLLEVETAAAAAGASVEQNELIDTPVEPVSDIMARGLKVIKDNGGSTNITREQLLSIVPMSKHDLAKTFRRARNRESAAFGNLRRKIRMQSLRSSLEDVRKREVECNERLRMLLHENHALRVAVRAKGASVMRRE